MSKDSKTNLIRYLSEEKRFDGRKLDEFRHIEIEYNVSKTALLKTVLALPSPPEQTAIATVLSDMDTEIESLESKLVKAREIKQGMMQELLTGRIRLV